MAFDYFMKEFFRDLYRSAKVDTDLKVGSLPLQIDCVIELSNKIITNQTQLPIPLLTNHFRRYNLFEFKSSHDLTKNSDLLKLMGYLGLWGEKKQDSLISIETEYTLWYLTANSTHFIHQLTALGKLKSTAFDGLYQLTIPFPCPYYLLVIEEIPCTIETAP